MSAATLGGLVVLALVDSTSFGTLLIPLWMMLAPALRPGRLLTYLATVGAFYAGVGLLLLGGVTAVTELATGLGDQAWLRWVQLVVGGGMLLGSFLIPDKPRGSGGFRGRAWRDRLTGEQARTRTVIGVALAATVLEVATMLPYLAAIGLVSSSDLGAPARAGVLTGYVGVMLLPALVALALRVGARRVVEAPLQRLDAWLTKHSGSMLGWTVGVIGFLVLGDAYGALFG